MNTTYSINRSIEFFRFSFISVIVLWHFSNIVPCFHHGDFAVDFFFILAGAMLFRSSLVHPDDDAIQYSFRRIKRIFPEWVITLVPVFLIKNRESLFNGSISGLFEHWLGYILRFFHEILFLGNTGLYAGTSNYASWFINVLITGGFIIYTIVHLYKEKATLFFFPVFTLLALTYVFTLKEREIWSVKGCIDLQFLRGSAEIALGTCLYYFANRFQTQLQKHTPLVNFLGVLSLILLVILLFTHRSFAPYVPLLSCFLLLSTLTDTSLFYQVFQHNIWITLGGISFEMLLIHGLVKPVVSFAGIKYLPPYLSVPLYLGLVIISAFGLKRINKVILEIRKQSFRKLSN